jgi:hypothetical protein
MMDDDRLGREQYRTNLLLQQIVDAGCRIFLYLRDQEVKLDSATAKFMQSVRNFGSELEREKAQQRARDAAERKAKLGLVTGGEPYGYENVHSLGGREVPRGQPHDAVTRRVKPAEADVVRGIFRMYAAGYGYTAIAKTLNGVAAYAAQRAEFFGGRQAPPPKDRTGSWAPTAIREMLRRRLYHGEIVWGQTQHVDRDGRTRRVAERDPSTWIVTPAPDLTIIDDALWEVVQARVTQTEQTYRTTAKGALRPGPDARREGKYLLSGLATCGVCGWTVGVRGGEYRMYGCMHAAKRGDCTNHFYQRVEVVESSFLATLQQEVLTPERFAVAVRYGVAQLRERLAQEPDRGPDLEREREALTRRIARMVTAIGDGRGPAALVAEIAKAEEQVKALEIELAHLATLPQLKHVDLQGLETKIAERLTGFVDLLRGDVPQARRVLKELLAEPVIFRPVTLESGKQTYEFSGQLQGGLVLQGIIGVAGLPPAIATGPAGRPHSGLVLPFGGIVAA